jgi:hypothetical protein
MERDFKGVWIPKEIYLNDKMNWSEKILLVEIDSLAKNGECFASNEHFAKFLGISKRQVQHLLASLKEKGYITTINIYKQGSKEVEKRIITPAMNFVTPCNELHGGSEIDCITPHEADCMTPHEINFMDNNTVINNSSFNNTITNPIKVKKNTPKDLENEFEQLWSRYPKKEGKKQAKKSFIKARKENVSLEKINSGLNDYINYIQAQNVEPQYIKHGSTWFNGECWNDEYNVIQFRQQRKGFLGLLDELEERGTIIDYPRGNNQDFELIPNMLPESLQDF